MTPLAWLAGRTKSLAVNYDVDTLSDGSPYYVRSGGAGTNETSDGDYAYIYKRNPIIFACVGARMRPFSEARFQFQEIVDGRPGKLTNGPSLDLLSNPWPNGTTGELLSHMEQDASLAGNFFATTVGTGANLRIRRLIPQWVKIVTGIKGDPNSNDPWALEAEPIAYIYQPPTSDPVLLTADRVVHYSPIPDPEAQWRGMSWLTPVLRDVQADDQATTHKVKYYENGATLGTVISYDATVTPQNFREYVRIFEENHVGANNAYRTLHIGGGADATVVGTEMKTDFKAIQSAGETRIASASGVGAIIAQLSEGLAGSSLNQGNYAAAKRQVADMLLRPLWRSAAASLTKFVDVPAGSRLWYDARDVEFLKEDQKNAAEIAQMTAATINSLVAAGYTPESVVVAVETGDLSRLDHSGLYSVQLQRAGHRDELTPPQTNAPAPQDTTPQEAS